MTIFGRCRCGSTQPVDDAHWITVRLMPASGEPSPSAWSLCSFKCVEQLAKERQA